MGFLTSRLAAAWRAIKDCVLQTLLAIDQLGNALPLGMGAVVIALITGERQSVAYCDETLSAHCFRAHRDNKFWGLLLMGPIDLAFSLFQRDEAGNWIRNHCERAYLSEKERRGLPPEYRDVGPPPPLLKE